VWATERVLPPAVAMSVLAMTSAAFANPSRETALPPAPPAAHAPRVDALPQPATRDALDLESLARGFAGDNSPKPALAVGDTQLLVFVSLAMPEATLKRLVAQASRLRARLVLRGLSEGSLVRTAARVQNLLGQQSPAIEIDPREFDRYAVRQVPTFVLTRSAAPGDCAAGQCKGTHTSIAGDVSLDYALRQIRDRAPTFHDDAARLLARLER